LGAWQTQSCLYLVLELCEGGDLAAFIRRNGSVDERVARNFMKQIGNQVVDPWLFDSIVSSTVWGCDLWEMAPVAGAGLQVLHRHHVVHRDLKPQVIFFFFCLWLDWVNNSSNGCAVTIHPMLQNILLSSPRSSDAILKISDFGLARFPAGFLD
jgi:serine/threonine protein kinase